jgi:RND family efflux transporter MFP subunit
MTGRFHLPIVAIIACASLAACGGRSPSGAKPAAPITGERFIVRDQLTPDLKPVAATVTTRQLADARARIGGILVRLTVKEGDSVRRGEVIGTVVDQRIGLETRAYDAQIGAAQAEDARARADLARAKDLYDHGVYAKARLDQVEASAKAAAGALGAARAQRAASAESAAQGAIIAPADGRVLHADVPPGSVVTPGQSIAAITAGALVIRVEVPEADARELKAGQTVTLTSDDLGQGARNAVVTQVYPAVAEGRVTADLTAPGLDPRFIGQRVSVNLSIGQRRALIVPARLVFARFGVDYVRVLAKDGSANDVPVQTAPTGDAEQVEILSGLTAGDVLVAPEASR